MKSTMNAWAEDLPVNCPPKEARAPANEPMYRLVSNIPPKQSDFFSHRLLYPEKQFRVDECRARSVSLFSSKEACARVSKLPGLKKKKVVVLSLPEDCGLIMQSGSGQAHFSWWMASGFDPLPLCHKVEIAGTN